MGVIMSKNIKLSINILSYWHAGTGIGRGSDLDALVIKDKSGLPYLPGKTIKGLIKKGMQTIEDAGIHLSNTTDELFGKHSEKGDYFGSIPGRLYFSNARLPEKEKKWLESSEGQKYTDYFYDRYSSTAIGDNGIAKYKSLRSIEVCIPVILEATISGPDDELEWIKDISNACVMVRQLGSHRNRGLGRCKINVIEE